MLQWLGLSAHAEAVYRAMLERPDHGVAALVADTGLDEQATRSALDELARLALLKPSGQTGAGLRPVSPEIGLATLLASAEAEIAERQAQVESARAEIAAIAAAHLGTRLSDSATRLEGLDAIRTRLEQLQRTTHFECLSLNPGGAHRPDARSAATPLNEEALRRGVVIRAVCRDSFRNDPDTLAYARWLTEHGGQMRTVPTVPIQMIIIDRRVSIIPVDPENPARAHSKSSARASSPPSVRCSSSAGPQAHPLGRLLAPTPTAAPPQNERSWPSPPRATRTKPRPARSPSPPAPSAA